MSKLTPYGRAVRILRLEKGMKLNDMAQIMELSAAFLSAVETGRKQIPDGFTVKIARALHLTADEVARLRKAADQTRREVRVDDKKAEDRELIAAFARKLDEVPAETIKHLRQILLKSVSGENPFKRKRQGFVVPATSIRTIRLHAARIRAAFGLTERIDFPIIEILEFGIPQIDPNFVFEVRTKREMGDNEGLVPSGGNSLILREDVYEKACSGCGRDRFTACHELGHYLMHRHINLARTRNESEKVYTDSEWQADTFAGALLMPAQHVTSFRGPDEMAEACKTSKQAAAAMWHKYAMEGIVEPQRRAS